MNNSALIFVFTIVLANAMPRSSTLENNNALLKVLNKRSIGCYGGCIPSCNTCSQTSCTQTCNSYISNNCCQGCCQNKCNICNLQSCQYNVACGQCCQVHCITTTSTTTSTTLPTSTTQPPTTYPPPPTVTPVRITISNTTNTVKTDVRSNVNNLMNVQNNVYVPINITNNNIVHISIKSRKIERDSERLEDFNVTTTERIPTTASESSNDSSKIIIINDPQIPHVYPLVQLPCFASGCPIRRPYWTGRICDGWNGGYPGYTGEYPYFGQAGYLPGYMGQSGYLGTNYLGSTWPSYGSRINLNDFYGCRHVHQDCTHCRSNFYRMYNPNSLRYGSCYGCLF